MDMEHAIFAGLTPSLRVRERTHITFDDEWRNKHHHEHALPHPKPSEHTSHGVRTPCASVANPLRYTNTHTHRDRELDAKLERADGLIYQNNTNVHFCTRPKNVMAKRRLADPDSVGACGRA